MSKKIYYKIGEACKLLDIQPYVLRYWETEFPMLRPDKSSSGQRVYTQKDLATIRRIKELLYDEGYTIAGAKKKLEGEDLNLLTFKPGSSKPADKPQPKAEPAPAPEPAAESKAEPQVAAEPGLAPPKKKKKASKKKAAAANEVAALRKGVEAALEEARGILALLD